MGEITKLTGFRLKKVKQLLKKKLSTKTLFKSHSYFIWNALLFYPVKISVLTTGTTLYISKKCCIHMSWHTSSRTVISRCFKNFAILRRKLSWNLFLIKLQAFIKYSFFERSALVAASVLTWLKKYRNTEDISRDILILLLVFYGHHFVDWITIQAQKHPPEVFCKKWYYEKFFKIDRKVSVPGSLF